MNPGYFTAWKSSCSISIVNTELAPLHGQQRPQRIAGQKHYPCILSNINATLTPWHCPDMQGKGDEEQNGPFLRLDAEGKHPTSHASDEDAKLG